jgi:predicted transcriptional regulator of viral defense system
MNSQKQISKLLLINEGHFTANDALQYGIDQRKLRQLISGRVIEKVAHGLYIGAEYFPDPFTLLQHRAKKSIFSHLTALYLHGFSTRDPLIFMMTILSGDATSLRKENNVRIFYNNNKLINLGVQDIETPSGTTVRAFNIERTLCDCIKYIDKLDSDLVLNGLKDYLRSPQRDSVKMIEYATALGIRKQVIRYLEVL